MKIDVFDYPTVVWRPLSREPCEYPHKLYVARNYRVNGRHFLPLIVWVYLHSFFVVCYERLICNRMRIGRSRSSKVVDCGTYRKGVCDFLLVTNSNFGPILHRFREMASYWQKIANFSYPTLVWRPVQGEPFRISGWKLWRKTRGMGLLYGENCKILTSTVFARITRVTDGRTDGRTDRQTDRRTYGRNCDSICALSIYAVARKNRKQTSVWCCHM